jgi:hypothetical protein
MKFPSPINFDTKSQEGITNITIWLTILIYALYIHFFIVTVNLPQEKQNYAFYLFVLFVPAAMKLLLFSGDPLANTNGKEARFFQSQFPDAIVAKHLNIDPDSARYLWFKACDRRQAEEDGAMLRTYQYGYTCRLVYYARRITAAFSILSITTLLFFSATSALGLRNAGNSTWYQLWWHAFLEISNLSGKLFYMLHVLGLLAFLSFANRADANNPTGVWARWKEVNDRNKAWVKQFQSAEELKAFGADFKRPTSSKPAAKPRTRAKPDAQLGVEEKRTGNEQK